MFLKASMYQYQAAALRAAAQTTDDDFQYNSGPISLDIPIFIDQHFVMHFSVRPDNELSGNIMMTTLIYDDIPLAHGWSKDPNCFDFDGSTGEFHLLDVGGNTYTVIVSVVDKVPMYLREQYDISLSEDFINQWDKIHDLCLQANIVDVREKKVDSSSVLDHTFFDEHTSNNEDNADPDSTIRFMVDRLNPLEYVRFEPYTITAVVIDHGIVIARSLPHYMLKGTKPFDKFPMRLQLRTALSETITPAAWQSSMKAVCGADPYQYPSNIAIALTKKP